MSLRRKRINILLIILSLILGGWAVWIYRRPPLILDHGVCRVNEKEVYSDTIRQSEEIPVAAITQVESKDTIASQVRVTSDRERLASRVESTGFKDIEPTKMVADHPFRHEVLKLLSGRLEETDSLRRHKILSYCEHLRASYTTRDIDFIRQVFSDNALIIVGHVVKTVNSTESAVGGNNKVKYSIRTKRAYLERLSKIFNSGKNIDVRFSEFKVMRHPTIDGIYGVTLRQEYSCGSYSDDGYLFLLWDFRNVSMPLIHVRTWQPSLSVSDGHEEVIGIADFNLE